MDPHCLWSTRGMRTGSINDKHKWAEAGTTHAWQMKDGRRRDEWNCSVASVYLEGRQATRKPAKGLKQPHTSSWAKFRQIDKICGKKQQPGDSEPNTNSLLRSPNYSVIFRGIGGASLPQKWKGGRKRLNNYEWFRGLLACQFYKVETLGSNI